MRKEENSIFNERLKKHQDELRWIYMELYGNPVMFDELMDHLEHFYEERNEFLKKTDVDREENPDWYKSSDMLGMMTLSGDFDSNQEEKIDYVKKNHVNCIHLELENQENVEKITKVCHEKEINVCMKFEMNHTINDHDWAKRVECGESEYKNRYFFYDNGYIPQIYEQTAFSLSQSNSKSKFSWLPNVKQYVMTTFYPYQWDLNYKNPKVLNEMVCQLLMLANRGVDILQLEHLPYIWKEIGTSCRDLYPVHLIIRMIRLMSEIVCPGVLLLGNVDMEPKAAAAYFGTESRPECHLLYNISSMAVIWHTVATKDTRLLRNQIEQTKELSKHGIFLNYLRCQDPVQWNLNYWELAREGMQEDSHRKFLNDYFCGYFEGSESRGETYHEGNGTNNAGVCGTCASFCGIESAELERKENDPDVSEEITENENEIRKDLAVRKYMMLHAYLFMQSGIPVLYRGDEVGSFNDYSYKKDRKKVIDARNVHQGELNWKFEEEMDDEHTVKGRIYHAFDRLEKVRQTEKAFAAGADVWTIETWDPALLCIGRYHDGEKVIGIFNFSDEEKTAWIDERDGFYEDLMSRDRKPASAVKVQAGGFCYLKRL